MADGFKLNLIPINAEVYAGKAAEFNLVITNDQEFTDTFILGFEDIRFSPITDPATYYFNGIEVRPNGEATTKLLVRPRIDKVSAGKNSLEIQVRSKETGEVETDIININVKPREFTPEMIIYGPNMSSSLNMPSKVDPRTPFSIKVDISNNNPFDFRQIIIKLESKLITGERAIDLAPNESKTVEITTKLDDKESPQKDTLHAYIYWNNTLLKELVKEYEVVPYLPPFREESSTVNSILKQVTTIVVYNDANTEKSGPVTLKRGSFGNLFERTNPESEIVISEGEEEYQWIISLKPGESATLTVTRSYVFWVLIAVLLILGGVFYYLNRSPLIVTKEVQKVEIKEGGLHEIKISITIKNRKEKGVKDVSILDKIPKLSHIHEEFDEGTIKPSKVYPFAKGHAVKWNIKSLDGFEERIITYSLKSKLSIIGTLRLNPVIVEYRKEGDDKQSKIISNSVSVSAGNEPIEAEEA